MKVNIGEQREFRLGWCLENHSIDVATPLRMSAGAILRRTGSQSVLVQRAAPAVVLMVLFSCTSTRLVCAEFLQTGAHVLSHRIAEGQG